MTGRGELVRIKGYFREGGMHFNHLKTVYAGEVLSTDAVEMRAEVRMGLIPSGLGISPFGRRKRMDFRIDSGIVLTEICLYLPVTCLNLLPIEEEKHHD